MKPRITLITLGVDDLQRAVRFYRDGLGLKTEGISASPTDFTIGHNVPSKSEVDAVMDQAMKAGAGVVKPAHDTFWGGYAATFKTLMGIFGRWRGILSGSSKSEA